MSVFQGTAAEIENNKNKVSKIDKNANNIQYPSAKAVFDFTEGSFKFSGSVSNVNMLPDSADIGEVYSVGSAKNFYNGTISQLTGTGAYLIPPLVTSFDVYAKTDNYVCGGNSYLYLVANEPQGNGIEISNFEGQNTLYLHFEIADSVATVTGERIYSEGETWEERHAVNQTINLPSEYSEMGFWLASEEVETEDGLRFSGPGLSVLRVTESVDSIATLYVYDGSTWLPLNQGAIKIDQTYNPESENAQSGKAVAEALKTVSVDLSDYYTKNEIDNQIGDIETALDSIISIQNSLIGGENL